MFPAGRLHFHMSSRNDYHIDFSSFPCTHKQILTFQRPKSIHHLQFISQVSTLKRDTCTVFMTLIVGFPSLVDSGDVSSIRLSLDPFCLCCVNCMLGPFPSEDRVTGSGGTRSVLTFTSDKTDLSPSEHWDRRYCR